MSKSSIDYDEETEEEKKFSNWVSKFESSIKKYGYTDTISQLSRNEIENTINYEIKSFPSWISASESISKGIKIETFASSSKDMKICLRHIYFPNILKNYEEFVAEAKLSSNEFWFNNNSIQIHSYDHNKDQIKKDSDAMYPTALSNFQIEPLTYKNPHDETILKTFFMKISNGKLDGIIGLCKLADISHRIERANEHDNEQLEVWVQKESYRKEKYNRLKHQHDEKLKQLHINSIGDSIMTTESIAENQPNNFINDCFFKFKNELGVNKDTLNVAIQEEEEARKLYEAAVQKRKKIEENVNELEEFLETATTQRETLTRINQLQMEMDIYNTNSAEKRLNIFNKIKSFLQTLQVTFVQKQLPLEINMLFQNLSNMLNTELKIGIQLTEQHIYRKRETRLLSDDVEEDDNYELTSTGNGTRRSLNGLSSSQVCQIQCALRAGIETIRMWRHLRCRHSSYWNEDRILSSSQSNSFINDQINNFEAFLKSALEKYATTTFLRDTVQCKTDLNDTKTEGFQTFSSFKGLSNTTVVLYFDHIHHDTPDEHVEGQSRIRTCLQMLHRRQHKHLVDNKKGRFLRTLNCNDIIAPPPWCLPLVHSPQYLSQLWTLTEQAKETDAYLPLEFDTEWETDDPYPKYLDQEIPSHKRVAKNAFSKLKRSIAVAKQFVDLIGGEEKKKELEMSLCPSEGEIQLAKLLAKLDSREMAELRTGERSKKAGLKIMKKRQKVFDTIKIPTQFGSDDHNFDSKIEIVPPMKKENTVMEVQEESEVHIVSPNDEIEMFETKHDKKNEDEVHTAEIISNIALNPIPKQTISSADQRFLYTDLKLHKFVTRLIGKLKVQRILGEIVGLNNTYLSTWIHGRTSSGLGKLIEGRINNWLQRYDRKQLEQLLDEDVEENIQNLNYAEEFLKRMELAKFPSNDKPMQLDTIDNFVDTEDDLEFNPMLRHVNNESDRWEAIQYSTSKKFVNTKEKLMPTSPSLVDSHQKAEPVVDNSKLEIKKNDVVATKSVTSQSPRSSGDHPMDKDTELLRQLLLTMMKNLKISHQGLVSEYYKYYREETSSGAVTSWFRHRGKKHAYERLTRCALLWLEYHQKNFNAEDMNSFTELCKIMNFPAIDIPVGSADSNDDMNRNFAKPENITKDDAISLLKRSLTQLSNEDVLEDRSPTKVVNHLEKDENNIPSKDKKAYEGDNEFQTVDFAKASSFEKNANVNSTDSNAHRHELRHQNLSDVRTSDDHPIISPMKHKISEIKDKDSVSLDSIDAQSDVASFPASFIAKSKKGSNILLTGQDGNQHIDCSLVKTLADLHFAINFELNRRRVSQLRVVEEANLKSVRMGQPSISRFLMTSTVTNNERGSKFCHLMVEWLKLSSTMPAFVSSPKISTLSNSLLHLSTKEVNNMPNISLKDHEVEDEDENASVSSIEEKEVMGLHETSLKNTKFEHRVVNRNGIEYCTVCDRPFSDFKSLKSFKLHLSWCHQRKNGINKSKNTAKVSMKYPKPTPVSDNDDEEDDDDNHKDTSIKKRKMSIVDEKELNKRMKIPAKTASESQIPHIPAETEAENENVIIEADVIEEGFINKNCEICNEGGQMISCDSCSCVYHVKCIGNSKGLNETDPWNCENCIEIGADTAEILRADLKFSKAIDNMWILVYNAISHRWRKGVIILRHPQKLDRCCILIKWWKTDPNGEKLSWIDITDAKVLISGPERGSTNYSRQRLKEQMLHSYKLNSSYFPSKIIRCDPTALNMMKSVVKKIQSSTASNKKHFNHAENIVNGTSAGASNVEHSPSTMIGNGMSDTYISSNTLSAALCAAGVACRAVDIAINNENSNVFACIRPPGHHAGRFGCTNGCRSTGFCIFNNAAIAANYARVRWGIEKIAVVDIDVHFGNGTAEILRNDPRTFFASVHMIYGEQNDGNNLSMEGVSDTKTNDFIGGFYPSQLGRTEISDNYVSVGVYPSERSISRGENESKVEKKRHVENSESEDEKGNEVGNDVLHVETKLNDIGSKLMDKGENMKQYHEKVEPPLPSQDSDGDQTHAEPALHGSEGYLRALKEIIIPHMEKFGPQLLIISAGFDGYQSDPLGGELSLSLNDYSQSTNLLLSAMERINAHKTSAEPHGLVISLLEGGYDTSPVTLGLARCVDTHVKALQNGS